jgi:uncharacterized DUF497 family protein
MDDQSLIFDWDEANLDHIANHEVTREEAEQAILGNPLDIEMQFADLHEGEERLLQIGETTRGRILQLLTTWRDGRARVISAWDEPKQLTLHYLAEMRRLYGDIEDSEV